MYFQGAGGSKHSSMWATVCLGLDACVYRDKLNEMFVQKLGL